MLATNSDDVRIYVISSGDKGTDIAKTTVLSVAYINNGGSAEVQLDVSEIKLEFFSKSDSQILWILSVAKIPNVGK